MIILILDEWVWHYLCDGREKESNYIKMLVDVIQRNKDIRIGILVDSPFQKKLYECISSIKRDGNIDLFVLKKIWLSWLCDSNRCVFVSNEEVNSMLVFDGMNVKEDDKYLVLLIDFCLNNYGRVIFVTTDEPLKVEINKKFNNVEQYSPDEFIREFRLP